eukprot:CAMPEP_0116836422 /NCGR_PEP_ID=MMETSP0418-20121206/8088_1 /TAXON_ID=1158023 /ORGANISM="Astrosyne radiata, Strain 13vi08-1A" /LENGTH=572 /DNA_ID=CAMNT_0004466191 /DNA_START=1057 /DNA_END=2775 /DNA_ORIENTATION=+
MADPEPANCHEGASGTCENAEADFLCNFDPELPIEKACPLVLKKMNDPEVKLTATQSIDLCRTCIEYGHKNAEKVRGKDIVALLGHTGAGKSTLTNYLMGCEMALEELNEAEHFFEKVRIVLKPLPDGGNCEKSFTEIGYDSVVSKTFMPKVVPDVGVGNEFMTYVDFPGFADSRGTEINLSNAVNIRAIMQYAKSARIVMLVSLDSIKTDRGAGFKNTLNLLRQVFGDDTTLLRYRKSLLFGITKAPLEATLGDVKDLLKKEDTLMHNAVINSLSDQLFLYDPIDRGSGDFLSRSQLREWLKVLPSIPSPDDILHTALTPSDKLYLTDLVSSLDKKLRQALLHGQYETASGYWKSLKSLTTTVKHSRASDLLDRSRDLLKGTIDEEVESFRDDCRNEPARAKKTLIKLEQVKSYFPEEELGYNLNDLKNEKCDNPSSSQPSTRSASAKAFDEIKKLFDFSGTGIFDYPSRIFDYPSSSQPSTRSASAKAFDEIKKLFDFSGTGIFDYPSRIFDYPSSSQPSTRSASAKAFDEIKKLFWRGLMSFFSGTGIFDYPSKMEQSITSDEPDQAKR